MSWLPVAVTTPPAVEPISLADARAQCHIDGTDFDTELGIYINAARRRVEYHTGTKLITQTVVMRGSSFGDLDCLPMAPLQSISSIKYLDPQGAEQTLSSDVYEAVLVDLEVAIRLKPGKSWPAFRPVSDAVRVTAIAGYGATAANVPGNARLAMLLLIDDWMRNRGDTNIGNIVNTVPNGVASLLIDLVKN